MSLEKIEKVTGRAAPIPGEEVDTDRIIPARFLKCVTFDGLGENLFRDVRYDEQGNAVPHPLNDPRFAGATVLVCGRNFGCGSSREHAPQAIAKAGFRAIVAESYAEIFFGNSTTLGIPCVSLVRSDLNELFSSVEASPQASLTIDLKEQVVEHSGRRFPLLIAAGARDVLMSGMWDPIGQLIEAKDQVQRVAEKLPYLHFA